MDAAALTNCQLKRGREPLSAFTVRYGSSSTYSLPVEKGKAAFVRLHCEVGMLQYLPTVS